MIFGVLSAIALGIGITATAQDLTDKDTVAQQDVSQVQIVEVRQHAATDDGVWDR